MPRGTRDISLRRPDGTWGGLSDSSSMGEGTFATLSNFIHNRDGTELRRAPGSRLIGQPFLGFPIDIDAVADNGGSPDGVTVDIEHHAINSGTFTIYIQDNSVITDGVYEATWTGGKTFTIATGSATGSQTAGNGDGRAYIQYVEHVHMMAAVDGRLVIVCETQTYSQIDGTEKRNNVMSWVSSGVMNPASVALPGYPVATPDDGTVLGTLGEADDGFVCWPCPSSIVIPADRTTPIGKNSTSGAGNTYFDDGVWDMNIERRITGDQLNQVLCLAIPGHGVMLKVDVGRTRIPVLSSVSTFPPGQLNANPVPDHRHTKLLGIPRAIVRQAQYTTVGGLPANLDDQIALAACYIDRITGEIGLLSDVQNMGKATAFLQTPIIDVFKPRWVLAESFGLDVVLFLTIFQQPITSSFALFPYDVTLMQKGDQTLSGTYVTASSTTGFPAAFPYTVRFDVNTRPDPDEAVIPRRIPAIEQMPRGASWVRVSRSRMFAGGQRPSALRVPLWEEVTTATPNQTEVLRTLTFSGRDNIDPNGATYKLIAGMGDVPSSLEGHRIAWVDPGAAAEPNEELALGVLKQNSSKEPTRVPSGSKEFVRPNVFGVDHRVRASHTSVLEGYIITEGSRVSYSEEGFPGVVPASNSLPVDTLAGRRTTGMARVGDQALVFTDRSTHVFVWSMLPRTAASAVLSTQHGCISAGSVVEGTGFAAWLSSEGPMAYLQGTGLRWIGKDILDLWNTFLKQSDGGMENAQAIHDIERGSIMWTLTTGWFNATDDSTKAKSSADTILVWNYRSNNFSVLKPKTSAFPLAFARIPINETAKNKHYWAPAFVAPLTNSAFYNVYYMDERYSDRATVPFTYTASVGRPPNSSTFTATASMTTSGTNDEAFIRSPSGELRWWSDLASTSGSTAVLNNAGGAVWKAGDILEARVIHARLLSNWLTLGQPGDPISVTGVTIRIDTFQDPDASYTPYSWAFVRVENQDGDQVNMGSNVWGTPIAPGTTRIRHGQILGEQVRVRVTIISNVQVRIKDISVEVV